MSYKMGGSLKLGDMKTGQMVSAVVSYDGGKTWHPNQELLEIGLEHEYAEMCKKYYSLKGSVTE